MEFYKKIKWILGILMVFVLIVTTNLIDRNNFVRVRDSVVTIYEDRLVAKDLIFDIAKSVHKKEKAAIKSDSLFFLKENVLINEDLQEFLSRYQQTRLTDEEGKIFDDLKGNLALLEKAEIAFVRSEFVQKKPLMDQIFHVQNNLDDLSEIQLDEGKKQMSISKRAIDTVELFTQIEIYLLIFLAIVIQIIVMYSPKEKKEN
ncbi:chemotaxis protein [Ascidiimonas aurantiaca]|uniref:chemotaxis protein n=1 Tax=Ascidiimonas aurantiaca TaxID=1685432 RepID=UPI0030EB7B0F